MGDDRSPRVMANRERDRELLIPVGGVPADDSDSKASASGSGGGHHHSGREFMLSSCFEVSGYLIDLLKMILSCGAGD
ncbi:hypothetical protein MA16_Dca010883 [Dendrobium catenatum]|uniref:Uncharacterized protein n=1 Tax=Dendrobium catenatum TaxID=906689 RepID=A0A2I0X7C5_9ASPA|nr:hypothetical protein MA16_Dca010883 [Dendrobium catenatum]